MGEETETSKVYDIRLTMYLALLKTLYKLPRNMVFDALFDPTVLRKGLHMLF